MEARTNIDTCLSEIESPSTILRDVYTKMRDTAHQDAEHASRMSVRYRTMSIQWKKPEYLKEANAFQRRAGKSLVEAARYQFLLDTL